MRKSEISDLRWERSPSASEAGEGFYTFPRRAALLALAGCGLLFAGCSNFSDFGGLGGESAAPAASAEGPSAPGQVIGSGTNKIALILPLSASGNAGRTAQNMRQAAEMALAEAQAKDVQILVKDDLGTPQGAQAAVQAAVQEQAQVVLGPLFAPSVSAAGAVARQSNIPMIAFSTDENVAAPGVYLLSFLPSSDVNRIIEFASSKGKHSYVGLLPDDAYGTVVEAEFRTAVTRTGGRLVGLERYPLDKAQAQAAIQRVIPSLKQADTLFIPDGADGVGLVLESLKASNVPIKNLKLLGTGRWDDPRLHHNPDVNGGWYAAPDAAGFQAFANRFRAKFGSDPARPASLSYDATLLVAALMKQMPQGQRFSENLLTNASGFAGVDGIFRFLPNGANQRGIAVLEIRNGTISAVSPAPKTFGAGT